MTIDHDNAAAAAAVLSDFLCSAHVDTSHPTASTAARDQRCYDVGVRRKAAHSFFVVLVGEAG